MADKMTPKPFMLSNKNVVGMLQRELFELGAYLSQPADNIDGAVVSSFVVEMAKFADMLPRRQQQEENRAKN